MPPRPLSSRCRFRPSWPLPIAPAFFRGLLNIEMAEKAGNSLIRVGGRVKRPCAAVALEVGDRGERREGEKER